jgi:hypothetical protein
MPAPIITHHKNVLLFPHSSDEPRSFVILKALKVEIQHLKKTFQQNGYCAGDIHRSLNPKLRAHSHWEKRAGVASVPFMQGTSGKTSRLLGRSNIRTVHIPGKPAEISEG